jgi:NAD-dependent SIR2 family protein deacetylase
VDGTAQGVDVLLDLLHGRRIVVLTGAGISTDSGIPDYRGPQTRHRPRRPLQHHEFVGEAAVRARYWARSLRGWPAIDQARPNRSHDVLAELEARGRVAGIITQNVDGLHHAAGSRRVVELHGALRWVRCLGCGRRSPRGALQERLLAANPGLERGRVDLAPDGDAELEPGAGVVVVDCASCGGVLKPDVVFFGGSTEVDVVRAAWELFEEGEVLLVLGSSLTVFSGYRFVHRAARNGVPVGIVSLGPTRGDGEAAVKLDVSLGPVMEALEAGL